MGSVFGQTTPHRAGRSLSWHDAPPLPVCPSQPSFTFSVATFLRLPFAVILLTSSQAAKRTVLPRMQGGIRV